MDAESGDDVKDLTGCLLLLVLIYCWTVSQPCCVSWTSNSDSLNYSTHFCLRLRRLVTVVFRAVYALSYLLIDW